MEIGVSAGFSNSNEQARKTTETIYAARDEKRDIKRDFFKIQQKTMDSSIWTRQ